MRDIGPLKSRAPGGRKESASTPSLESIKSAIGHYCESRHWPGYDTRRLLELSDSDPFEVTSNFALYKQFLVYERQRISYSGIEGLSYRKLNAITINASPGSCILRVFLGSMATITLLSSSSPADRTGRANWIPEAYRLLSRITFQQRMAAYIKAMEDDGYAMIEGVRVYPNGSISQEQARTNPVATTNRGLPAAGPQRSGSGLYDSPGDSFEFVAISGMGAVSRWIRNRLTKDQDVVTVLLSYLGK